VSRVEAGYHDAVLPHEGKEESGHACNVICAQDGIGETCELGEGAAIAWEALKSAGVLPDTT